MIDGDDGVNYGFGGGYRENTYGGYGCGYHGNFIGNGVGASEFNGLVFENGDGVGIRFDGHYFDWGL